jgi:hypothetical protein
MDKQFSLPSVFRITRAQYRDEFDFTATTSSNPTRQAYVAVTVQAAQSSTPAVFAFQIYVSMDVEFFNNVLLNS